MDKETWFGSNDWLAMVRFVRDQLGERPRRLCSTRWARLILNRPTASERHAQDRLQIEHPKWAPLLDRVEEFADDRIPASDLPDSMIYFQPNYRAGPHDLYLAASQATYFSFETMCSTLSRFQLHYGIPLDQEIADVLRDLVEPYERVYLSLDWLDWNGGAIPNMARNIYDNRDFETLPILADALEDAGCSEEALLTHCRSHAHHGRGCWALDLLLQLV